jgi:hypothetical protein
MQAAASIKRRRSPCPWSLLFCALARLYCHHRYSQLVDAGRQNQPTSILSATTPSVRSIHIIMPRGGGDLDDNDLDSSLTDTTAAPTTHKNANLWSSRSALFQLYNQIKAEVMGSDNDSSEQQGELSSTAAAAAADRSSRNSSARPGQQRGGALVKTATPQRRLFNWFTPLDMNRAAPSSSRLLTDDSIMEAEKTKEEKEVENDPPTAFVTSSWWGNARSSQADDDRKDDANASSSTGSSFELESSSNNDKTTLNAEMKRSTPVVSEPVDDAWEQDEESAIFGRQQPDERSWGDQSAEATANTRTEQIPSSPARSSESAAKNASATAGMEQSSPYESSGYVCHLLCCALCVLACCF